MPKQPRAVLKAALFLTVSALAAPAVAASGQAPAPATSDVAFETTTQTRTIELTKDSAIAIQSVAPFRELSVANPDIADISTISNTGIYVVGKTPGRTTLMLMGDSGEVMTVFDVRVAPDISELKVLLDQILPDAEIDAFTANDGIVLAGTARSDTEMRRAVELAQRYAPGRVSNLVTIARAEVVKENRLDTFSADLARLLPGEAIRAEIVGGGIVLSGTAGSDAAHRRALSLAESAAPGKVTSFVDVPRAEVAGPDAAEVARNLASILPGEKIEVHMLGGALILSGRASSDAAARRAVEVARLSGAGAEISNMIEVAAKADCEVRTRRGADVIVTTIPCREDATADMIAPVPAAIRNGEELAALRPMPRPAVQVAQN